MDHRSLLSGSRSSERYETCNADDVNPKPQSQPSGIACQAQRALVQEGQGCPSVAQVGKQRLEQHVKSRAHCVTVYGLIN